MRDIETNFIPPTATIKAVFETIERCRAKIALVVDENRRLLGTVTDGDIRRGMLAGLQLTDTVVQVMNSNPRTAHIDDDRTGLLDLMRRNVCRHVPILDDHGRVVALQTLQEVLDYPRYDNWVVLMAGGLGKRLRPLTEDCPKPLLPVGDKPILQLIIETLKRQGFHRFYISVNYLGHMIQEHFGDGSSMGVEIRYLLEEKQLGTAGPISLLPELPTLPIIVMNGDILTKVNFRQLLEFHEEHNSLATMSVREYAFEVPFGVVELEDHHIVDIVEKPVQRFLVNAGIYVLGPEVIEFLPRGEACDMPALFRAIHARGKDTCAFPIREYWLDIGRPDDFRKANIEFANEFILDPKEKDI